MKNTLKVFAAVSVLAAAMFGFVSCSDSGDDDETFVSYSASGDDDETFVSYSASEKGDDYSCVQNLKIGDSGTAILTGTDTYTEDGETQTIVSTVTGKIVFNDDGTFTFTAGSIKYTVDGTDYTSFLIGENGMFSSKSEALESCNMSGTYTYSNDKSTLTLVYKTTSYDEDDNLITETETTVYTKD